MIPANLERFEPSDPVGTWRVSNVGTVHARKLRIRTTHNKVDGDQRVALTFLDARAEPCVRITLSPSEARRLLAELTSALA